MKSIILNGNGCTVFNANGDIIYRIDNYNCKCNTEVYLMDLRGSVLFTILKKKFRLLGRWEGYRWTPAEKTKPWFQVRRKLCRILQKNQTCCEVTVVVLDNKETIWYRMESWVSKSACKIVDQAGRLVAVIQKKQTSSGILLGDDVWTLEIEPNVDHLLIMGLVIVCGFINHNM
ncbi:Lurp-one-related [Thalictrum thalictroides]|uniref:Lurp-one-related n=1 Tax=Thalictrum thalictroides TaxID=46969 RepID=A0A7J6X8X4_THATH|nr:Lurp-one-related [Thalictrum thalictroides]